MKKWVAVSIVIIVVLIFINRKKVTEFILSFEQEAFIKNLHRQAQDTFRQFIKRVQDETGYTVIVTSGYRSFAQQASLYNSNSSNSQPGYSFHNYGLALDINLQKGLEYIRKSSTKEKWINSGVPDIAESMGFRWGGVFSTYYDPVHFDLGNTFNTTALLLLAHNQFGNDPNNIKGNELSIS